MKISWVILDIGETLIDESRIWATWARHVGVSPLTFGAALGAVIAQGQQHSTVFDLLGVTDWRRFGDSVEDELGGLQTVDLYPDALLAEQTLRERGYRTALIANQPASRHDQLLAMGFRPEVIAMSESLGVSKPDDAFTRALLNCSARPTPRPSPTSVIASTTTSVQRGATASDRCGSDAGRGAGSNAM